MRAHQQYGAAGNPIADGFGLIIDISENIDQGRRAIEDRFGPLLERPFIDVDHNDPTISRCVDDELMLLVTGWQFGYAPVTVLV